MEIKRLKRMKLTEHDKTLLLNQGFSEEELIIIENASNRCTYSVYGRRIVERLSIQIIGREAFLIALSEAAFIGKSQVITPRGGKMKFLVK